MLIDFPNRYLQLYFTDDYTIYIEYNVSDMTSYSTGISRILGVKYKTESYNGSNSNESISDTDINNAITDCLNELNN